MILTEYNEEVFVRGIRDEGIEEGIERGREEGRAEGKSEGIEVCIANLMNSFECSREEAMRMLKVDRD